MTIKTQPRAPCAADRKPAESFVLVLNPAAGGARRSLAAGIAARLTERGRSVAVESAPTPGDIRRLAQTTDSDALLVAGGDGSVNEAVRGLLARPAPRPKLGIIPQGTVNVLMRALGLPRAPEALAEIFRRGAARRLHLGLANGRPFLLMASAGLDAAVVAALDPALKKRIGRLAYAVAAAKILLRGDFPDVDAETESGVIRAKCVVVAKANYYGGPFVIDTGADVTKPGLTLVALTEVSPRAALALARYFATGRLDEAGCVRKLAVRRVTLRGAGVATQIDGDRFGETPLEIRDAEESLDVLA